MSASLVGSEMCIRDSPPNPLTLKQQRSFLIPFVVPLGGPRRWLRAGRRGCSRARPGSAGAIHRQPPNASH
eukprot:4430594-Alexandrium_andersonii.AAC.1